jgi:hypothetical protein
MLATKFTGLVMSMVCWHDDNYQGDIEVLEKSDRVPF